MDGRNGNGDLQMMCFWMGLILSHLGGDLVSLSTLKLKHLLLLMALWRLFWLKLLALWVVFLLNLVDLHTSNMRYIITFFFLFFFLFLNYHQLFIYIYILFWMFKCSIGDEFFFSFFGLSVLYHFSYFFFKNRIEIFISCA